MISYKRNQQFTEEYPVKEAKKILNKIIIGVADMQVSDDPNVELVTYSLGSCLGLVIYDPRVKVGGIAHIMLPESKIEQKKVIENPFKFVDTGIPLLFKAAYALGAKKSRLIVKGAGCGRVLNDSNLFNIGQRNEGALRKLLWKNNVLLKVTDFGGNISRTIRLRIGDGTLLVRYNRALEKAL